MTKNITTNKFNEAWIAPVWKELTQEINYRTYNINLPMAAADIASRAITYALKPGMKGSGEFPTSKKHLLRTARKIAKWEIIDAIKKDGKMPGFESFDEREESDDGEVPEISRHEAKCVMLQYRETKNHEEILAMGKSALGKLDAFLTQKGVSKRDIEIYKARDLYKEPTKVVCAKHAVTPANLYKIVSVIKSILRNDGRALVQD